MKPGLLHTLIGLIGDAVRQLGGSAETRDIEEIAVLVHRAMTLQTRSFHTLEHVLNFADSGRPISTLAGAFHDLVYYQVDLGFLPEIATVVRPYLENRHEGIAVASKAPTGEPLFEMVLRIFGFERGHELPIAAGLNEFLSAVVMVRKLAGLVPAEALLRATLCIEGTIPFRSSGEGPDGHIEQLLERLPSVCASLGVEMGNDQLVAALQDAVVFANKDVGNFADEDASRFLDNTWKLLPEMNVALRSRDVYSIRDYRRAIEKMEAFMASVDPASVFHQFRGVPSGDEFRVMNERARSNMSISNAYLRVKLVTQAFLEALAEESGGDAPLSLFMGDLPGDDNNVQRLEKYLPSVANPSWVNAESGLHRLLESGRSTESAFDLKSAPLALFVFRSLAPDERERCLGRAREMFAGRLSARGFLDGVRPEVVRAIARACAALAPSRSKRLQQISAATA